MNAPGPAVAHLVVGLPGAEKTTRAKELECSAPALRLTPDELERWRAVFEEPDDEELRGVRIPPAPSRYTTWSRWASWRWPSLPDRYGAP